jgi:hypothetical protein
MCGGTCARLHRLYWSTGALPPSGHSSSKSSDLRAAAQPALLWPSERKGTFGERRLDLLKANILNVFILRSLLAYPLPPPRNETHIATLNTSAWFDLVKAIS